MNKSDIQRILSSASPTDLLGRDPEIQAALKQVQQDPELAAWWKQEQDFDDAFRRKFSQIEPPASLKATLLGIPHNTPDAEPIPFPPPRSASWWRSSHWISLAASIVLILGLAVLFLKPKALEAEENDLIPLYNQLSENIGRSDSWEIQSNNWRDIADYLNKHEAPAPDYIADKLPRNANLRATTDSWRGMRVSIIAIQSQDKLYLAIIPAKALPPSSQLHEKTLRHNHRGMNWHATANRDHILVFIFSGPIDETKILF